MVVTVLPSLRFSVSAPAPVTTTASRASAAWRSSKSASVASPGVTVTRRVRLAYPTRRVWSSSGPARTLNW